LGKAVISLHNVRISARYISLPSRYTFYLLSSLAGRSIEATVSRAFLSLVWAMEVNSKRYNLFPRLPSWAAAVHIRISQFLSAFGF
jgi:hypothetical protein